MLDMGKISIYGDISVTRCHLKLQRYPDHENGGVLRASIRCSERFDYPAGLVSLEPLFRSRYSFVPCLHNMSVVEVWELLLRMAVSAKDERWDVGEL